MNAPPPKPALAPKPAFAPEFDFARLDPADPDMWQALYLDQSVPIDDDAKRALLRSMRRRSRRLLLPLLRPLARLAIVLLTVVRLPFRRGPFAPRLLHRLLVRGLRRWVAPEANHLILRHFHIGTELCQFIKDNVPGLVAETVPLRPRTLDDLADNAFLQHDVNVFLLVGRLGEHVRRTGRQIGTPERIDFSAITDGPFAIDPPPDRWRNRIDLQSAVEAYTPVYQAFLGEAAFWRASNSLQLDEAVGVAVARILGSDRHLHLVSNGHPLIPESTLRAGWRLMLHGLAAEQLHYHLRQLKRAQMENLR